MRASARQREIIDFGRSDRKLLIAEGAVRSGKTAAAACAHAAYTQAVAPEHDHAIVGYTSDAILRNVVRAPIGTISALKALGFDAEVSGVGGQHVRVYRDTYVSRIWIIGLADAKGQDRLAGSTFASALVDEGSRIDKDAFSMPGHLERGRDRPRGWRLAMGSGADGARQSRHHGGPDTQQRRPGRTARAQGDAACRDVGLGARHGRHGGAAAA